MAAESALAGRQILILSSIEWDAAWQRHQAFARQWAEAGHEVFFVENTGFRGLGLRDAKRVAKKLSGLARGGPAAKNALPKNLRVINPLVLPPAGVLRRVNESVLVPRLAEKLAQAGLSAGCLAVAYLPTPTTLALLDQVRPDAVVYDCVDNFSGHPDAPDDLARTEGELLRRSALVVTTSSTLRQDKEKLHSNVLELHHGVSAGFFLIPARRTGYRRFCYFGTLWRAIDYAPVRALAEAGFEIELIGPIREPLPPFPRNVAARGPVAHEKLPRLLEAFDGLLLPYADDDYNKGVIPAKIYECLATGRPVLASPLPALSRLGGALYFCRSGQDWVAAARSLEAAETPGRRAARVALAQENSSERAFARLRQAVAESLLSPHGR